MAQDDGRLGAPRVSRPSSLRPSEDENWMTVAFPDSRIAMALPSPAAVDLRHLTPIGSLEEGRLFRASPAPVGLAARAGGQMWRRGLTRLRVPDMNYSQTVLLYTKDDPRPWRRKVLPTASMPSRTPPR